jgi:ParB/RepB/Spo0J family partition protein
MIEKIERVRIELIRESKTNPRKTFNPADEKELVESIKASTIVSPLILRQSNDGQFEIVDGARRFRAAKVAGLAEVPSILRPYTDEEAYEVQLISFAQRVDIHPLDEAAAYEQLRKKKFDIAQIAAKVGKGKGYIARRLQLTSLIAPAKKAFSDGSIALNVAIEISRLDDAQQKDILRKADDWDWDLEQIRRHIASDILLNLDAAPFKKSDAMLVPAAGACIVCPKCTAANMALFDDISKKGNHCLDTKCFSEKLAAFAKQLREKLEEEGKEVILVSSEDYQDKKDGALGYDSYSQLKKNQTSKVWGHFIDGDRKGMILPILLKGKHKAEQASSGVRLEPSAAHKKELYKRRCEIFENRVEQEARLRTYGSMLLRMKWPVDRKDFEWLVCHLLQAAHNLDLERLGKCLGVNLEVIDDKLGYDDEPEIGALSKLTDQQLVQVAFGIVLEQELISDPLMHIPGDDRLASICSRHNVDRKEIHDKVAKEMEGKKPKPPAAETKKPKRETKAVKSETTKAKAGTCRICGCTQGTPCISKMGIACAWADKSRTLCDTPICVEWDKKAKAKSKAKKPAKKKSKK